MTIPKPGKPCPECVGVGWLPDPESSSPYLSQECGTCSGTGRIAPPITRPNPHIALIYHYDLARALAGEVVDWQAIPVNVDAGREGGDLCRAAADFAKRRDLFAMPAPPRAVHVTDAWDAIWATISDKIDNPPDELKRAAWLYERDGCFGPEAKQLMAPFIRPLDFGPPSAVPTAPTVVEQQAADPEPSTASTAAPGPAVESYYLRPDTLDDDERVAMVWDRECLRARIRDLVDQGHEPLIRQWWPEGVPTLKHDGHTDAQLQLILACVRRVEAEVGAGWHPDDGPPPHVNTDPRASVEYPRSEKPDEGGPITDDSIDDLNAEYEALPTNDAVAFAEQIAREAHQAGRSISVSQNPTVRRWSIARAVIAWAASGRTLDDLWFAASNLATFEQCRDPSATLGGLISQFTIEQADRLYEASAA